MTSDRPSYDFGYFTSLSVENTRCFAGKQTLDLSNSDGSPAKWTILLGNNGTGKTTLLQCVAAMEPISTPHAKLRPGDLVGTGTRMFGSSWPGPQWNSAWEALRRGDVGACRVAAQVTFGAPLSAREPSLSLFGHWERTSGRGSQFAELGLNMLLVAYGASRKPGTPSLAGVAQASGNAATLFDETATLLAPDEWLLQADYAVKSDQHDARARQRFEQIRDALTDLMADVSELRIVRPDDRPLAPRVEAKTPYGWVRIGDLSLGYRTLMTWVVDFAQRLFTRYPESENPLAEPAVCLVDEIDLHLHPRWQRQLISFLDRRFPKTQFIVTAHSPLVVQAAERANIAVLERHPEDDFVTIHNDREAVHGWRIDQILTSDLFGLEGARSPKVNEVMRERRRILGQAELSDDDRERLARLDAEIADLPEGETPADQADWEVVRRFAAVLRENGTEAGRG